MADITVSGLTSPLGKPVLMTLQGDTQSVPFPIIIAQNGGVGFEFTGGLITVIGSGADVQVTFDRAMIYDGSYTPVPGGVPFQIGQPTLDAPTAKILTIPVTANSKPNLTRVTPNNSGQGVAVEFDSDIAAPVPPTIDPPVNGLSVTSATLPDARHVQLDLSFPSVVSTTLVSVVAADKTITMTFNKAVALSNAGQQPSSYLITTSTPGAVVPSITSIVASSNQVILHTTEQTDGATYVVTVSPGSIYGTT